MQIGDIFIYKYVYAIASVGKIGLLRSNFCRLVGMNFYARKRHTLMVSFVAAHLGGAFKDHGHTKTEKRSRQLLLCAFP